MSEFIAEAEVQLRASSAKFLADVDKAIKAAEKQTVTITVRASMKGFRADLNQKLERSTKGLVIRPLVRASMAGFRADLERKVLSASRGVAATVGVKAGGVTQGSGQASTVGARASARALSAEQATTKAIQAGIFARQRVTGLIDEQDKRLARIARQEAAIKAAELGVAKAIEEGNAALQARNIKIAQAAREELAVTRGAFEKEAARRPEGRDAEAAATASRIEAEAAARIQADREMAIAHQAATKENQKRNLEAEKSARAMGVLEGEAIKEDEKRTTEAIKNAKLREIALAKETAELEKQKALAQTTVLLSPAVSNITRTRDRAGRFIAGGGAQIGADAAERNQQVSEATKGVTHVKSELAKASRISSAAELIELDVERKLVASRAVLRLTTDAVVLAEEAYEAALGSGSVATIKAVHESLELAKARQLEAAASTEAAGKEATRAGFLTTGRRALVAQIANLTGLRGAALTAASGFIAISAAVIGLRKAVGVAADLQTELAVFNVTAGATADQMDEVHAKALELGKDLTLPGVSAGDAAVALTELSKAGLSVQDSLDGARGVLQLATAANIDFTQATNLTASALNAFGLSGEEASHVADVLANSANESQGSITDAGVALQQSAAVARQAGLSLEQTVATLTLFARAGLRGSDAGTSLRTALIRLINPSNKAQEVIDKLGLKLRTATGAINLGVFQQFTDKTRDLTAAQRDQALAIVFGQDAIRGAAILAREGAAGLKREEDAVNKSGTAALVASARTSGYAGSVENLKNQIEGVGEILGSALLPSLTAATNATSDFVAAIGSVLEGLGDLSHAVQKPFNIIFHVDEQSSKNVEKQIQEVRDNAADLSKPIAERPIDVGGILKRLVVGTPNQKLGDLKTVLGVAKDLNRQFNEFQKDKGKGFQFGLQDTKDIHTFREARIEVAGFVEQINKAKGAPEVFNDVVINLRKIRDEFATGTFEEQQFSQKLNTFITNLQNRSARPLKKPIVVPVTLTAVGTPEPKKIADALKPVREQVKSVVDAFNFGDKSKQETDVAVKGLQKLQAQLSGGTRDEKQFADRLTGLIDDIQTKADSTKIEIPIGLKNPRDLLKDLQGRDFIIPGQEAETAFWDGFKTRFLTDAGIIASEGGRRFGTLFADGLAVQFPKIFASLQHDMSDFVDAAKTSASEITAGVKEASTQGENQASGFDRRILEAQLANDVNAEIAVRKQAIKSRQNEIARIEKAARASGAPIVGGRPQLTDAALKGVNDAKKDIEAQNSAIEGLVSGQAADAKAAAQKIKDARDAADQAFLDALSAGRTPLERKLSKAQKTEGEDDNIKALLALQKRIAAERKAVGVGVKDIDTKKKEIKRLSDELFNIGLDIADARETRDKAAQAALATKGQAIQSIGESTNSIKLIIKGIDIQIAAAKVLLVKAIQLKTGQEAARAALEALKKTRRDTIQSAKDALLSAAFDLAEARDNKSQMLQILDVQIDQAKKEVAAAKTLLDRLVAQAKVQNLINKKKEIIAEEAKKADDKQGITVFDLLKQNVDVFNKSAGNLIGPNQPFAGAFGFTADIAQFLTRRGGATGAGGAGATGKGGINPFEKPLFSGGTFASRGKDLTSQLIDALQELTKVAKGTASESKGTGKNPFGFGSGAGGFGRAGLDAFKQLFVVGKPKGLLQAGNLDVLHRPHVRAPEGGVSTVRSITVGLEKGMAAVIPTVLGKGKNARIVSDEEAKQHFRDTGENLGIFSSEKAANVYANALHKQQERMGTKRSEQGVVSSTDRMVDALDRNTAALLGTGGNGSTADANPKSKTTPNNPWGGRRWFAAAGSAKAAEEA